ncbi:MAG: S-layer homology domain-containing protein [Eubacterium sp.]
MKFKPMQKAGALAVAVCLALSAMPVFAADTDKIEVILTDVTETDLTTLSGEAKIKVSVKGAAGDISEANAAFTFSGDLDYKSVDFLQGSDDYSAGDFRVATDRAEANAKNGFSAGFISSTPIKADDETELFIITFNGEAGKSVTVTLDKEHTFLTVEGKKTVALDNTALSVTAIESTNESTNASVKLTMDKVPNFNAGNADGVVTLSITNERTNNVIKTKLSDEYRGSGTTASFTVENAVLKNDTYTVEISGSGYIPYKKTGVTFDKPLELTNADFIPGDVNNDGKIDEADKTKIDEIISAKDYSIAADFNRDGYVNEDDAAILGTGETSSKPAKMSKPTVTGGSKKITVKWNKASDADVTGYTIKYGTSNTNLSNTKDIDTADTTSTDITGLLANTTYYVQIAAKNSDGTGEFSDTASAKTDTDTTTGGGGGGGGGAGGGGGSSSSGGSTGGSTGGGAIYPTTPTTPEKAETFTDLENHAWAKDSIYALKEKGIISGISETEFAPGNNIKRGDFILILTRMLSVNDEFTENFADVPESAYYYSAVGSAKAAGIASGDGANFMPEASITRQDLITLAYRAFLAKGYIVETEDYTVLDAFADKDNISDYAAAPMASMVKAGIIQGSDGNVSPKGNATRAEVAVMCARLCELMK